MKTKYFQNSLLAIATVTALTFMAGNVAAQDSTAAPAQSAPQLSYGVPQVLQLVQAKISDGIIVNYIQNSGTIYGLNAGEIVYLKQQGASDIVLNAMLNQRSRLTGSTEPATSTASAPAASDQTYASAAPAVTYVQQSVPSSTVYIIPDTQTYRYNASYYGGYPYHSYPAYGYYGYPAVSFSFGFGNHWGGYHSGGFNGGGYHSGGFYGGGFGGGWHHR